MSGLSVKRIAFVGFGLLASSIAAAIKQAKLPTVIRAVSSPSTLKRARELDLADEFFEYGEAEKWARDCDLILLCGPILHILRTIDVLGRLPWLPSQTNENRCLVCDIGSTKVEICKAGQKLPSPFQFVGSHPMAGSEKRTCEYNDPAIFENAYWFVCPPDGCDENAYKPLLELIRFLGATAVVFPPEHHDRTMAWVSHMPQMLSSTLAGNLPERLLKHNYQHFAGRAFRDMTRIAASGWGMWHDIAVTNRDETVRALEEVRDGTNRTIEAMKAIDCAAAIAGAVSEGGVKAANAATANAVSGTGSNAGTADAVSGTGSNAATANAISGTGSNAATANAVSGTCSNAANPEGNADKSDSLAAIFKAGNDGRASLFAPGRNAPAAFFEITVPLKDKPGALLSVMEPLAQEGLNIRDIELMKVRENVAGTLLLAFKTQDEALRAVKLLNYLGYEVKER